MHKKRTLRKRELSVRFGSKAEDPSTSAAGPLRPAQRTNAEASLNDCMRSMLTVYGE